MRNYDDGQDVALPTERECGECVFFRNGSESDFCALTMERPSVMRWLAEILKKRQVCDMIMTLATHLR